MTAVAARRWVMFFITGLGWGIVAYLLGRKAFGVTIWGGLLASPFIGIVVGGFTQARFERVAGFYRALVALLTLYSGAIGFGLAVGLFDWARRDRPVADPLSLVSGALLGTLWGVTAFSIALWPMTYATHRALEWDTER